MNLSFHQRTFDLLAYGLDAAPLSSSHSAQLQRYYAITLPHSVAEWWSIAGHDTLLQQLTFIHEPVTLDVAIAGMRLAEIDGQSKLMLPVLLENQGVWQMAVALDHSDDPSVYLAYDERGFNDMEARLSPWLLHAYSFSDWIYAFAWDYDILANQHGVFDSHPKGTTFTNEMSQPNAGPETFEVSAYFVAKRFYRYHSNGTRFTVMIDR